MHKYPFKQTPRDFPTFLADSPNFYPRKAIVDVIFITIFGIFHFIFVKFGNLSMRPQAEFKNALNYEP